VIKVGWLNRSIGELKMNETLKVLFEEISNIQFFTLNETTFNHSACAKTTAFEDFEYTRNIILKNIKKALNKHRLWFLYHESEFCNLPDHNLENLSTADIDRIIAEVNSILTEVDAPNDYHITQDEFNDVLNSHFPAGALADLRKETYRTIFRTIGFANE